MSVINALFPLRGAGGQIQLLDTLEALVIGINRTMQARDAYAILICDEGDDREYRNVVRALGETDRSERVVEDAFFKGSEHSYFIQLTDFCGYALLRREAPTPIIRQYGSDQAFALIGAALVTTELSINDTDGIIRPGDLEQ